MRANRSGAPVLTRSNQHPRGVFVSMRPSCVPTLLFVIAASVPIAPARDRHVDTDLAKALEAERSGEYDKALELIRQVLAKKPSDMAYRLAEQRIRFEDGAIRVHNGQRLRDEGKVKEALAEFERAYS